MSFHRLQLDGDAEAASIIETLRKELPSDTAAYNYDLRTTLEKISSGTKLEVSTQNIQHALTLPAEELKRCSEDGGCARGKTSRLLYVSATRASPLHTSVLLPRPRYPINEGIGQ